MAFSTVYSNTTNQVSTHVEKFNHLYPIKLSEISVQTGTQNDLSASVVNYEFILENVSNEIAETLYVFIKADDELQPMMQKNNEKEYNPESRSFTAFSNLVLVGSEQKLKLEPQEKSKYSLQYEIGAGQDLNIVKEKALNATLYIGSGNPLELEDNAKFQKINLINY